MKKWITLFLLFACAIGLFGCEDASLPTGAVPDEISDITVSFAGWHEGGFLGGLNADKMAEGKTKHFPIYKLDTLSDVAQFRENSTFVFNHSHNGFPSFNDTVAKYDEDFFATHSLLVIYLPAESGTYRYGVQSVVCEGGTLLVTVEQTNSPEAVTLDLTGWFITLAAPKSMLADCNTFDAVFGGIKKQPS